jgi:hypothetical protein
MKIEAVYSSSTPDYAVLQSKKTTIVTFLSMEISYVTQCITITHQVIMDNRQQYAWTWLSMGHSLAPSFMQRLSIAVA